MCIFDISARIGSTVDEFPAMFKFNLQHILLIEAPVLTFENLPGISVTIHEIRNYVACLS